MSTSPTQRSLARAREWGWAIDVAERWVPHANVRRDLFGIFDLVAIAGREILGIQATSGSNHAARVSKMRLSPLLPLWVEAGGVAEVWSWRRSAKRVDGRHWQLRRQRL